MCREMVVYAVGPNGWAPPAPSCAVSSLKLSRGGRAWSHPSFTDFTTFVTLYRSLPLSLSFLINKTAGLGKMISNMPKNGAESRVIKGSSLVTD